MKILELILENFAPIYVAMKKKYIKIDLRYSTNRVVLLVGDNGTGKTSILSQLHPFAYPGNMDIRNNAELILDRVDGYKEIHIQDGDNIYIIKHHYLYSLNGRTVKSFIMKNGIELNPNGNVTSFKELIMMEFSLELDYLKLIRLGSNVTNFIDMKAAERKNFASNLLSDIDTFSSFYRKVNNDSRTLNSILRSVTDKLDKLKILDENDIKRQINELDSSLQIKKTEFNDCNSDIGKIQGSIETLIPEGIQSFDYQFKLDKSFMSDYNKELRIKETKLNKFNLIVFGNIESSIKKLDKDIDEYNQQILMNTKMNEFYFKQLNNLYEQKTERENNLKYITSDLEYDNLKELYDNLFNEYQKLDKIYNNYNTKCTKDDILTALKLMQEIDSCGNNINAFSANAVDIAVTSILGNKHIETIVRNKVSNIDNETKNINLELLKYNNSGFNGVQVMFKPPKCEVDNCPYIHFYNNCSDNKEESNITKLNNDLKDLDNKRDFWLSLLDIEKNIDYIFLLIKTNKNLIDKLPEDFFNIDKILKSIRNCIPFYDEDYITNYVLVLEEYEHYKELKDKMINIEKELQFIKKNSASITTMQNELYDIDKQIYSLKNDIEKLNNSNEYNSNKIESLTDLREDYISYNNLVIEISDVKDKINNLNESINNKNQLKIRIDELLNNSKELLHKLNKLSYEVKLLEDDINENKFKLQEFKSLSKEKNLLNDKYDDVMILRESLSSNKGIPILFINLFFKDAKIIINKLLNLVYNDELSIDNLEVDDKEFKIPYTKNGRTISDVAFSSQGEQSFISLAISFALLTKSIEKYNIMLLDEIDSALDQKNRALFIKILEEQLDSIEAEQVFMITHNNMFDCYPVDLIMTSDVKIDNYKYTNIIFKA